MPSSHLDVEGRTLLNPDRIYSADEIARFVGRSVRTLQNWRRSGAGPRFHRVHDTPIYVGRDVLLWLNMYAEKVS